MRPNSGLILRDAAARLPRMRGWSYCPFARWSKALSTASVIAVTPVSIVGFGTGANMGEWLAGSGGPFPLNAAMARSGS